MFYFLTHSLVYYQNEASVGFWDSKAASFTVMSFILQIIAYDKIYDSD
jgi:hypothetical protein